jgi:hypothetical protein
MNAPCTRLLLFSSILLSGACYSIKSPSIQADKTTNYYLTSTITPSTDKSINNITNTITIETIITPTNSVAFTQLPEDYNACQSEKISKILQGIPKEDLDSTSHNPILPRIFIKELNPKEVAIVMFCEWLESYRSTDTGISIQLKDYLVWDASLDSNYGDKPGVIPNVYYAGIRFSVLPKGESVYWIAGNGIDGKDGWIIHKYLLILIRLIKDNYQIEIIGTGG